MGTRQTKEAQTCANCGKAGLVAIRVSGETVLFKTIPPSRGLGFVAHTCIKKDVDKLRRKQGPPRADLSKYELNGLACRALIKYTRGEPVWKYFKDLADYVTTIREKDPWPQARVLLVQTAKWSDVTVNDWREPAQDFLKEHHEA
jgi:hypothetical protein